MAELLFRFVKQKDDWVSDLICVETRCPYAHVGLLLSDGSELGAHSSGGVEIRPPNYAVWSAQNTYRLEVTDEGYAAGMEFAHKQIGTHYDFLCIAGILFKHDWNSPKHTICSLLAQAISQAALRPIIRVPVSMDRITPRDLWISPLLEPLGAQHA